jgi:SAM-dependent methyltransferase
MLNPKKLMSTKCIFCGSTDGYKSIEGELGATLKEHQFPYSLSDFETLSYRAYKCQNCGSSDRDRLYRLYLDKYEKFTKSSKVLDFAPSKLIEEYMRSRAGGYLSADLLIDGVDEKVDITDMAQFKDNTFNFFICSHVLEHVDDDSKALSELYRILKPGGKGILMTPVIDKPGVQDEDPTVTDVSERWRRFAQDDHVRLYEKSVFINRVKDAGFIIHEYGFWNLGIMPMIRNGIRLKSRLYVVEKGRQQ